MQNAPSYNKIVRAARKFAAAEMLRNHQKKHVVRLAYRTTQESYILCIENGYGKYVRNPILAEADRLDYESCNAVWKAALQGAEEKFFRLRGREPHSGDWEVRAAATAVVRVFSAS